MRSSTALQTLHLALGAAIHRDLPQVHYEQRDWEAEGALRDRVGREEFARLQAAGQLPPARQRVRRPSEEEVEVVMFPQTWGSTALGYGGIGGAAITSAYTVVVLSQELACVYFGGDHLAYTVPLGKLSDEQLQAWNTALARRQMENRREAVKAYGAVLP
ncbi:hypothetical protein D3C71_19270 [compost metagenome]